jgi:hypothetical protein
MAHDRKTVRAMNIIINKYNTYVDNKRIYIKLNNKKMEAMDKIGYPRNAIVSMMDESGEHNDAVERCLSLIYVCIKKGSKKAFTFRFRGNQG